jgi:acyl-CoA hydrolase
MMGSDELYAWADNNPRISMLRTEHCNSPALIARNHAMTSVNGALEVDLHGQSNASRVKGHIYSGFGGSTDFIVGRAAFFGWSVVHGAAVVASQGGYFDHRPPSLMARRPVFSSQPL